MLSLLRITDDEGQWAMMHLSEYANDAWASQVLVSLFVFMKVALIFSPSPFLPLPPRKECSYQFVFPGRWTAWLGDLCLGWVWTCNLTVVHGVQPSVNFKFTSYFQSAAKMDKNTLYKCRTVPVTCIWSSLTKVAHVQCRIWRPYLPSVGSHRDNSQKYGCRRKSNSKMAKKLVWN